MDVSPYLHDSERFESFLYLAKNGLKATIVSEVGIGSLELSVLRKDNPIRTYDNQLDFSGAGIIVQNPAAKLFFHDHHGHGDWMLPAFGLHDNVRKDYEEYVPITREHLQQYASLYGTISETRGTPYLKENNQKQSVKGTFKALKDLSLELHRLATIVARGYIIQDTKMASMPVTGKRAKQRRNSARISTGAFDADTHYFIAYFKSGFTGQTMEAETYKQHRIERQLSLFNPPVSI